MRWMRRHAAVAASTLMALFASGCPAPVISVTPGALNFSPQQTTATVRISNAGGGSLTWQVQETLPWLDSAVVSKQASGNTGTETDIVEFTVNRGLLPVGLTSGNVTINSNGDNFTLPVSVQKNGPAQIEVSAQILNFGALGNEIGFTIANRGLEPLTWSIPNPVNAPWLSISPRSGAINSQNGTEAVTATVSRTGLAPGEYTTQLVIESNSRSEDGTDDGIRVITVDLMVVPFSVTPASVAFGLLPVADTTELVVRNLGGSPLNLTVGTIEDDENDWLSATPGTINLAANGQATIEVTADPNGLEAGDYSGKVNVFGAGVILGVPVTMSAASLVVAPEAVDFSDLRTVRTDSFTITNLAPAGIDYTVSISAEDRAWLSVDPTGGTVTNSVTHTLTANPALVEPGEYEAEVAVTYEGGTSVVAVTMDKPRPPRLVAVSENINFGTTGVVEQIDIWNDGFGSIDWSIDTSGFPAWLSIDEAGVGGTVTGTVSGDITDTVTLRVNRALAPVDTFSFTHEFQVTGIGDFNGAVTVTVNMTVPQIPVIEIESDGVDDNGVNFINLDVDSTSKSFIIRNLGNGVLQWNFITAQLPFWISSITPSQGGINPNTEQTVTVSVDRTGLDFRGAQVQLSLVNNDPDVAGGALPFIIEVQVPKSVAITGRPTSLSFGPDESVGFFEVANDGDPGTELFYRIRSTKENWLKVFPENGSSLGTEATIKDFKLHTAVVVRSEIEGSGSSGKLIVEAIRTNELGQVEVIPDVVPLEINVSVEAAELTFQHARPRLRVPSMVRFVMLMRNVRFAPIPISETRLDTIADRITLFEDDREVEITETAKIIKGPRFIRGNILVLLDYSNSMQEAAGDVADPAISGAADPLQALYERTIAQLLDEIPSNYRVGIAVFSERSGTIGTGIPRDILRPIYGTLAEGPETNDQLFLEDRQLLQDRLGNIFVATNGATELYPAISEASSLIVEEDNIAGIFPYDDADDRIVLCVTDGRATTPPGEIAEVSDQLALVDNTRAFIIGWGNGVSTGPMVQLATETGGHVYSTATERVISGGVETDIPVVEELENYCSTIDADPCDLSVRRDLEAQFLFSYVSLTEEGNVEIEGRLTFDDPNDQASSCLPEQGDITGKFTAPQTGLNLFAGDPRLGQIKLIYGGLNPDGTGQVLAYMDSAVRDITSFTVQLTTENTNALARTDVDLIARLEGGLIADWTVSGNGPNFTFTSPDGTPLTFGDFGPLFSIDLDGIGVDAFLNFRVTSPVFNSNDPNGKYFTYPDAVRLTGGGYVATSFPRPLIELDTVNDLDPTVANVAFRRDEEGRLVLDLGTNVDSFELALSNLGGSHTPTITDLEYTLIPNTGGIVRIPNGIDSDFWTFPTVASTRSPAIREFIVDRNILPTVLDGRDADIDFEIEFEYALRGIGYSGNIEPLYLTITVLPPVLGVAPQTVDFPIGVQSQNVVITNQGQGTLNWEVQPDIELPPWLSITRFLGALAGDQSESTTLAVDRTALLPGSTESFSFNILVRDETNPQSVTVDVTVNN